MKVLTCTFNKHKPFIVNTSSCFKADYKPSNTLSRCFELVFILKSFTNLNRRNAGFVEFYDDISNRQRQAPFSSTGRHFEM